MKIVNLGTQGLKVSQQGLGCMGMSEFYGDTDETQGIHTIHRAIELGVTFLDTATAYGYDDEGPSSNERLLGKALKGKHDQVVIATKFGPLRSKTEHLGLDGSPENARKVCEQSLKNLGTDVIDLYYLHRVDPNIPIEESVGGMADLVKEGKVRYLGLSEVTVDQLKRAQGVHPISAVQTEYSLWSRDVEENGVLQACRELGVGFVPYSPLGRGFLTGSLKDRGQLKEGDWRLHNPRFTDDAFASNLRIVEGIEKMAAEKGCTPAQLALAWVHAQGEDMVPIPGTKRIKYLEQNIAALDVQLTHEDVQHLQTLAPVGQTVGERY
ncbi:aldo/keto reductase [Marininema halotolerans]|uniref:Predicted oxidoreductase n=1 Tax=Marininema halotolerans TaxID=1155944 RepID=A0A1I6P3H2_9BACL|nr:aldo/keto reductase [Marininema halotolerans]SFS34742.1 Predicted oxidoreductase [Marininema halotolerans]